MNGFKWYVRCLSAPWMLRWWRVWVGSVEYYPGLDWIGWHRAAVARGDYLIMGARCANENH